MRGPVSYYRTAADWQREQAVYATQEQQAALRKALLQRIADRLAYARALEDGTIKGGCWSCCWLRYDRPAFVPSSSSVGADGIIVPAGTGPVRTERWLYRLCDPATCAHFHHETEVFLA